MSYIFLEEFGAELDQTIPVYCSFFHPYLLFDVPLNNYIPIDIYSVLPNVLF